LPVPPLEPGSRLGNCVWLPPLSQMAGGPEGSSAVACVAKLPAATATTAAAMTAAVVLRPRIRMGRRLERRARMQFRERR
jgi:hypothetical protein